MNPMGVDAPPSADVPRRGGFLGFLGTIPGILTAVAGVITALATLYTVDAASRSPEQPPEDAQQAPDAPVDADSVATRVESAPAADDAMLSDPATELWMVEGDEVVGRISLRHELNELLPVDKTKILPSVLDGDRVLAVRPQSHEQN